MRVILVEHDVVKGIGQGRVGCEIAKTALEAGLEVTLAAISVEADLIESGAKWIKIIPRQWPAFLGTVAEFAIMASRVLEKRRDEFDVIHAFGHVLNYPHHINSAQFVHAAWLKIAARMATGRPGLYAMYQWLFTVLNTRWERETFRKAQQIVACSDLVREELHSIGFSASNVQVIENGVDSDEFSPGDATRMDLNLPDGATLAVFVGDIQTQRKNLDTVLRALSQTTGVHLAVIGDLDRSPYPAMAERLRVGTRVHFLGFRRDVNEIMRGCDFLVFPSRYEPFGNVVLEAMAAGIPVVTAKTVGAASLVTKDCGIVLADCENAVELATALQRLADDPVWRRKMGHAARMVASEHTWKKMGQSYLDLYQQCAARRIP